MRTRKVIDNDVTWIAITVSYPAKCAVCNHPMPLTKGDCANYRIEGTRKTLVHLSCTPIDINRKLASQ